MMLINFALPLFTSSSRYCHRAMKHDLVAALNCDTATVLQQSLFYCRNTKKGNKYILIKCVTLLLATENLPKQMKLSYTVDNLKMSVCVKLSEDV